MITRTSLVLLCVAGFAAAQQGAVEEALRRQAAEVSRLMRESEKLLLEITRVDRLVEAQRKVEEDLKKLLPPPQEGGAAGGEAEQGKREELERQHQEIDRRLEEMLAGERESANRAVQQLEELLRQLPRQQQQQGSGEQGDPTKQEREKRLRDKEEQERKQHQPQSGKQEPRDPKDPKQRSDRKPREEGPAAARRDRVEAWIANLPPEDRERINQNDFSRVPLRYRKLVEEYTAQRAKRAAEQDADEDR